jgi:hypothetical protein
MRRKPGRGLDDADLQRAPMVKMLRPVMPCKTSRLKPTGGGLSIATEAKR